eukprot:11199309-Alexandrium_andersonii.AAC.1
MARSVLVSTSPLSPARVPLRPCLCETDQRADASAGPLLRSGPPRRAAPAKKGPRTRQFKKIQ